MSYCIVRYSEIGLKGKNRIVFERKLIKNIRSCLKQNKIKFDLIEKPHGRIIISGIKECRQLNSVFGISSFSKAINAGSKIKDIKLKSREITKGKIDGKSFAVYCQRLDKSFPLNSPEFAKELGSYIKTNTNFSVNLKNPDIIIYAEIIDGCVYLFDEKIRGPGGLPLGVEGNVTVIIEDESSLLSALFMMKRGCDVFCVAYTEFDISILKKYAYGSKVELKVFKSDKEIENFAVKNHSKAIIVSDSIDFIKEYDFKLPIYRPLSALNKKQIEEKLNEFRKRVY
ncbi:hypothetical protein KY314_01585 [Candidatus Woesearchaeota archaeon]|nr:hypothetical protein [Candidatus Woesearchaeota archaeon]